MTPYIRLAELGLTLPEPPTPIANFVTHAESGRLIFLSGQGYRAIWSPDEINMIAQDDPRHRQQRMLVQHKFTRAAFNLSQRNFSQQGHRIAVQLSPARRVEIAKQAC